MQVYLPWQPADSHKKLEVINAKKPLLRNNLFSENLKWKIAIRSIRKSEKHFLFSNMVNVGNADTLSFLMQQRSYNNYVLNLQTLYFASVP